METASRRFGRFPQAKITIAANSGREITASKLYS
jgi:hypothetical protein